ncbi:exosome complex component rrp43-like protein [Trifolium pratense]|uniref:Ribosomal RNA-processing protein 43 n=2 Tax=Trifolium TaxID=3898 RepID=A0A2K3P8D3_TRIPR|nr:exosome complex component rrp43-like protein [Trifolium pratense]
MSVPNATEDLSSEVEVDAFRRLFPVRYFERHLSESIRPDGRPLKEARDTSIFLGSVASANGSALVKIGSTTMLTAIKMEVMTPSLETPDEGCLAIDFHMPAICSPIVRPGRPAEAEPVVSKQLSDTISRQVLIFHVALSGMIDLKELSLVSGKAAWMAYLDIYCLDADGALFDTALLSAVAALSHAVIVTNADSAQSLMSSSKRSKPKCEDCRNMRQIGIDERVNADSKLEYDIKHHTTTLEWKSTKPLNPHHISKSISHAVIFGLSIVSSNQETDLGLKYTLAKGGVFVIWITYLVHAAEGKHGE